MIETYCDACGARLEGVHESGELENMVEYAEKAKRGKHGKS